MNGDIELMAKRLHGVYGFTHVVFQAEQDILRAAKIRAFLGISGQSVESALRFRDKVFMKQVLSDCLSLEMKDELYIPEFKKIESAVDVIEFIEEYDYPVVIKPARGMGSINTFIVKDEEQLEIILAGGLSGGCDGPIDLEIENFCEGSMYHIDGVVYDGVIRLMWVSKYLNTCVDYKTNKFLASYSLSETNELTYRMQVCVEKILEALEGPESYSFHVELFHRPDDTFGFCEAACRTGGANVAGVMLYLFHINLNKASLQGQCCDPCTSPLPNNWREQEKFEENCGWLIIYPEVGYLEKLETICPFYDEVIDWSVTDRRDFSSIEHCTDSVAMSLIVGNTEEEVIKNIEKLLAWYERTSVWKEMKTN